MIPKESNIYRYVKSKKLVKRIRKNWKNSLEKHSIEIRAAIAINDLLDVDHLAYLLKHSCSQSFAGKVEVKDGKLF
jgi:glyceraldehyde-3-phosphate dehydrogenase/erythrose-4-phosphate dehydrogenase